MRLSHIENAERLRAAVRMTRGAPGDSLRVAAGRARGAGAAEGGDVKALGVIETFNAAAAITAADAAAKTSLVSLIELRLARGMCGKSYVLLTGDVAAVTAAIERAETVASEDGMLLDSSVIPNPDKRLWDSIL